MPASANTTYPVRPSLRTVEVPLRLGPPETPLAVGNWKGPPERAEANAGARDCNTRVATSSTDGVIIGWAETRRTADDEGAVVVIDGDDDAPDPLDREPDEADEAAADEVAMLC